MITLIQELEDKGYSLDEFQMQYFVDELIPGILVNIIGVDPVEYSD